MSDFYPKASDFTALLNGNCANARVHAITKVTPHHTAGIVQGENAVKAIATMWKQRKASANYIIDVKGRAYLMLSHDLRAWTSSNRDNDMKAITFEMSNDKGFYPWSISQETLDTAIDLTAWIMTKYGIIPIYNGTPNASITTHRMFGATQCPGDYFVNEWLKTGRFVNAVISRKTEWDKRIISQLDIPTMNGDNSSCYIQIGAYKNKANAVKQASTLEGYAIINDNGLYKVRKHCTADNVDKELAIAREKHSKAFRGVYNG